MNNDTDPDQRSTLVAGGTGTLGTVVPVYGPAWPPVGQARTSLSQLQAP